MMQLRAMERVRPLAPTGGPRAGSHLAAQPRAWRTAGPLSRARERFAGRRSTIEGCLPVCISINVPAGGGLYLHGVFVESR